MDQHPLPQAITSYEFKLVGSMTLKQFVKLAIGVGIGLIFYAIKIPGFFKWFLVLTFSGLGATFAFVPFNDVPLEKWVAIFLRRIFSPTLYFWKQQPVLTEANVPVSDIFSLSLRSSAKNDLGITDWAEGVAEEAGAEPPIFLHKERKGVKPSAEVRESEVQTAKSEVPEPKLEEKIVFESPLAIGQTNAAEQVGAKPVYEVPKRTVGAEFEELPLPAAPTVPNIIVGIILDEGGKLLKDAIVEIQNARGEPLRALRTNALGQFRIATPLENGKHFILIEKEPYLFDTIEIMLEGKIIPALKIKAKSKNADIIN